MVELGEGRLLIKRKNDNNLDLIVVDYLQLMQVHGNKENRLHADMDSNGRPQTGRNKALKLIKKANLELDSSSC